MEYLEIMKAMHENILQFLDDDENKSNNAVNKELLSIFQQNHLDRQDLKSILRMISKIAKNHHRTSLFYEKIQKIISILKNQIKQEFSNIEIFNFFKKNKLIILLLINDNILTFDSEISTRINKYKSFFYIELNKLNEINEIPENYEEKRLIGENDSYLCELIRNDRIESFIIYYTKEGISPSTIINQSIYETNSFLEDKKPSIIQYSAFFGSIQIFRFLFQNQAELTPSLWIYAIHGRNPEIIHFLEENHIYPRDKTYQECLKESIKCHHNDFALYFLNNLINEFNDHSKYLVNEIYYALKLALENNNNDIFNYLINLPEIEIGQNCFKNCTKLTKFIVPNSATFIGDYAFCGCRSLSDITIPSSVTSLQNYCFDKCFNLKNIILPSSLTYIGDFAFNCCQNLTYIDIPSSVKSIGNNVFNECKFLKKVVIPSSVTSIGDNFVEECEFLSSIIISSNVKIIGKLSFRNFSLLKEFIIPPCVTTIYEKQFDGCSSLKKIEIPSSVTRIEKYAFNKCTALKQITIPPSVTSIEDGTFSECISLKTINIPDSVTFIGFDAFFKCISLVSIMLPSSINKIGNTAFNECSSLKRIIYKNDPQNIEFIRKLPKSLKIIFVGDTDVGKTCFVHRYVKNNFLKESLKTVGSAFVKKEVDFQGGKMEVLIWDIAGRMEYRSVVDMCIRDLKGAAVFFDINNPETFHTAKYFLKKIRDYSKIAPMALIGNKCDLEHNVSDIDIIELEKEFNAKYFEVSVKNNYNIEEVIDYFITEVVNIIYKEKNQILNLFCNDDEKECTVY